MAWPWTRTRKCAQDKNEVYVSIRQGCGHAGIGSCAGVESLDDSGGKRDLVGGCPGRDPMGRYLVHAMLRGLGPNARPCTGAY
jgi:hypothetical protein